MSLENNKKSVSEFTNVKPYNNQEAKTIQLSRMFNAISGQYDKFNDIMSWGMARVWRKKALSGLKPYNPKLILDIATGTGDFAIGAFKYIEPQYITAIDISEQMMQVGLKKVNKAGLTDKIKFEIQDCSKLSFSDNAFDAATIAFGIRNFEKLNESLQQIHRILKPGGKLLILEMNEPQKGILLKGYQLYTRFFVRMTSQYLSADSKAYDYLTASMHSFASGKQLIEILAANDFDLVNYKKFTLGVCSMYLVSCNK